MPTPETREHHLWLSMPTANAKCNMLFHMFHEHDARPGRDKDAKHAVDGYAYLIG